MNNDGVNRFGVIAVRYSRSNVTMNCVGRWLVSRAVGMRRERRKGGKRGEKKREGMEGSLRRIKGGDYIPNHCTGCWGENDDNDS